MQDDLNLKENGRKPQFAGSWKMTTICWQMEEDLGF